MTTPAVATEQHRRVLESPGGDGEKLKSTYLVDVMISGLDLPGTEDGKKRNVLGLLTSVMPTSNSSPKGCSEVSNLVPADSGISDIS